MKHPQKTPAAFFRERGYVLINTFLSRPDCLAVIRAVDNFRRTRPIIKVDRSSLLETKHFMTLNGSDVEDISRPANLYASVNQVINSMAAKRYVPLDNKAIGLSINIIPPGEVFSWHYDRNEITAILYLNEVVGGEMEFYPRYRLLMKSRHRGIARWVQRLPDALMRPGAVRSMLGGPNVVVKPEAGTLLIMEAARCLHRVRPVTSDRERYSVQFAYDLPGVSFGQDMTRDYYGYKKG